MTLDDCIKRYEIWASDDRISSNIREEHKQIVKWLKSYKKMLEQEPILDKMRAEFVSLYPKNYAEEPELGGLSCAFSLNKVLNIIDKYKTEREE